MESLELEKTHLNDDEVQKLWEAFKVFDENGDNVISVDELGKIMTSLGQSLSKLELRDLIKEVDVDSSGSISFEEFKTLLISRQGDRNSRLKLAFGVFDVDKKGDITVNELHSVMSQFGLSDSELEKMIKEVDHDGDGAINFEEFCKLVPEESTVKTGYKSGSIPLSVKTKEAKTQDDPQVETVKTTIDSEITRLQALLAKHPQQEVKRGTSLLQMQIGLFRLIQGAAYRCFRESFSANHETHLQVRNLPYRIPDFVEFVKTAIALYKALDIVSPECHIVLDSVVESIVAEYDRLEKRIENWQTIEKTPEMLAEENSILSARNQSVRIREKFAAGIEYAITLKKKRLNFRDVAEGVLALNELNRLRQMELNLEMTSVPAIQEGDPKKYLKKWNRVILLDSTEAIDGAMMPVAYWYEEFMPLLLAAFSVSSASDIQVNTIPDEAVLDEWYNCTLASGEFKKYGVDVETGFQGCTAKQKLMLKQAWRLTHHYLNGVQKQRERLEAGRTSGDLSCYIAFIDVYLNRSYVKNAEMRVSFPYYIGPAVWRFFHTTAEITCTKTPEQQTEIVNIFKDFFKYFASIYPCPYCRHHLNFYVVQNKEVEMYPVEYLLLGRDPRLAQFEVSLEAKLSTLIDGPSLRLFFWKLHNTVSSSISRSEEWYHKDEKAFYTTRFWPSLDAELARAKTLQQVSIAVERIYRVYSMLKPMSRLAGVRSTLQKLLDKNDPAAIHDVCQLAQEYVKELETTFIEGKFLQETYYFEPTLIDESPYFTPEEEEFARTGIFVEV